MIRISHGAAEMTPEWVGRYRILRRLGAGGMGEVYLGEDPALNRRVAIKMLPRASGADAAANARLLREAQAAATLDHPYVCAVYEVGEHNGAVFIAMQYTSRARPWPNGCHGARSRSPKPLASRRRWLMRSPPRTHRGDSS